MLFSEITNACYDFLGAGASDPAFPAGRIQRYINIWLDGVYADVKPDVFTLSQVLTVDSGLEHQYSLAQQSPAITGFRRALEVRLTSDTGIQLFEKTASELGALSGPYYAITGLDHVAVLTTCSAQRASEPVFLRYAFWPARLSAAGDQPSIPTRFHHLAALGAAELAFAQGGEGQFPGSYARMLADGRSQLLFHLGRRSLDVATVRSTDART